MKFEFVDNTAIDGSARRRIRSHVATGRNAGKKLSRPSRRKALESRATRAQSPRATAALVQAKGSQPNASVTFLALLSPYTLSALPAHLQQHGGYGGLALLQGAVSFLGGIRHAPELDVALDYSSEPRSKWVQPLFLDEAYFHGAMAVFFAACPSPAAFSYTSSGAQDNLSARMRHLCLALRLVNTRLSGTGAISDETVIVVLVLGMYERQQGEYHRGLVHLGGLQRMVQMRGGVGEFIKARPDLSRKIFRSDVEYCLHLGAPTRFTLDEVEPLLSLKALTPCTRRIPPDFPAMLPPTLATLLEDATQAAHLLNTTTLSPSPKKLNSSAVHGTFILLGYRVQALSPLLAGTTGAGRPAIAGGPSASVTEQVVCLGLAAFVGSFLWGGGCGGRKMEVPVRWVGDAAREIITCARPMGEEVHVGGGGGEERWGREAVLWMLFVGDAAGVFDIGGVDGWVIPRTAEVVRCLGLCEWESVGRVLGRFPWVDALHARKGRAHWERCMK
ncbi:hypothetical protein C8A01DRAFT_17750 [Parachaetomium inaequale]|uniref:Uncharacterized protein n=1 Tax=Parachaetomium inaequale TaxID=2588326 RepID=A0AAN6PBX5_9PEZI|nr:hypothetical protein C8A01DRAFT_17750 [Parachaetomium inaequale]